MQANIQRSKAVTYRANHHLIALPKALKIIEDRGDYASHNRCDPVISGDFNRKSTKIAPSFLRFASLLFTCLLGRSIWNAIVVTRHWQSSTTIEDVDSPIMKPNKPMIRGITRDSRIKRPSKVSNAIIEPVSVQIQLNEVTIPMDFAHHTVGMSWKDICSGKGNETRNAIDASSRILISGIISHPLSTELAFALTEKCGVKSIVGLDYGTLHSVTAARYAYLLRRLPNLQIHRTKYPQTEAKLEEIFKLTIPTHIFHFEPASFHLGGSLSSWPEMIEMRTSLEIVQRLCNQLVKQQHNGKESAKFLYITSQERHTGNLLSAALETFLPVILQTYQIKHSVQTAQIKLPAIYGPYEEGSEWMTEEFLAMNSTNVTINEDLAPMIHLDDAVLSVISSLTNSESRPKGSSLLTFLPPSDLATNLDDMHDALADLYSQNARGVVAMRMSFMLSWHHKRNHPYGGSYEHPSIRKVLDFSHKQLSLNRTVGLSELQIRHNYLFPCKSECSSSDVPCRNKTAYSSVFPISRNMTRNCRFVLYASDFSPTLSDLPLIQDNEAVWPRDTLCQIAFVSDKSPVVTSVVQEEKQKNPGMELHTATLNGKLTYNNWHLIWLNHNVVTQSEADYMMPKIAPGVFFSKNVTKAMYVEPRNLQKFPPLQVIWFMMAKQLDAKKQRAATKRVVRSGTSVGRSIHIPEIPAKHIALFAHAYDDTITEGNGMALDPTGSIDMKAKYVLQQKGVYPEQSWPRRQLQFYGDAFDPDEFDLIDTFLLIHNLQSERSRRLRCEWYEEQLFWSDEGKRNRDLEDLSLSFVLASWRRDQRLMMFDDSRMWGERMIDPSMGDLQERKDGEPLPSEYFVRIHPAMGPRRRY